MGHTLAEWTDRVRGRLGDLGVWQHIRPEQVPIALEDALLTFSKDKPRIAAHTFAGNGATFVFNLVTPPHTVPWVLGWSVLTEIEYPAGDRIPKLIEVRFATERDGVVTMHETTPATGSSITFRYNASYPFPTDIKADDVVPKIYFQAVTALAGSRLALGRGIELARQQSNSVAGQLYNTQPEPLFAAAKDLEKIYNNSVLGRGAGGADGAAFPPLISTSDQDIFSDTLFHRRSQLVE